MEQIFFFKTLLSLHFSLQISDLFWGIENFQSNDGGNFKQEGAWFFRTY